MPLLSFWNSDPETVGQLTIEQIVSTAGKGSLRDGTLCSEELRAYLSQIPTAKLASYVEHCLSQSFTNSGMVLQDLVNEIGRRLDYDVVNGRYQGTPKAVGYDGLWRSPEGDALVVEVKTTDVYRIPLNTLAAYRSKVIAALEISENSSILIVVGREDTGELEAQIRGSRHAWDIRLISAEALLKLLQIKENSDESETGSKIRSLFAPVEYTRLDRLVDIVFTAVSDAEEISGIVSSGSSGQDVPEAPPGSGDASYRVTDAALLQSKRMAAVSALARRENVRLLQKSRAQYWTVDHHVRAVCAISKRYTGRNQDPYWYAYHPHWDSFLRGGKCGYFILGCMDRDVAFAIPREVIHPFLKDLHTTTRKDGRTYWHIHLVERADGLALHREKARAFLPLNRYVIPLLEQI